MTALREQRINQALRNWADGDLHCMAAVELLIDHGYWPAKLDQAGYLETWNSGHTQYARPKLIEAILRLEGEDDLPRVVFETCSSTEGDVLYLAASLAFGHPINLSKHIGRFDTANARRLTRAIGIATRLVQV